MFVVGPLEDQMGLLIWGMISSFPFKITITDIASYSPYILWFQGLTNPFLTSQPLIWLIVSLTLSIFGASFYNILLLISIILTFLISFIFFRNYKYPLVFALIFTFSASMWSHLGIHIPLIQHWLYPLLFIVLWRITKEEQVNVKSIIKLSLVLLIATLFSNYEGFILILFSGIYMLLDMIYYLFKYKNIKAKLINFIGIFTLTFILLILTLSSYFQANYINVNQADNANVGSFTVHRPIEDFVFFSSRPWYFLLPPPKNPFLGSLSENLISHIKSTSYFLADDYFAGEHSGNYFGILLLGTFLVLFYLKLRKKINLNEHLNLRFINILLTTFIIFTFMMPPFFTILGIKIYTPGYLIYLFFPMFRVTARFNSVVLFSILTMMALLISDLKLIPNKKLSIFMTVLLIVTLLETFIPVEINYVNKAPEIYSHIKNVTPVGSVIATYPYNSSEDAFLWVSVHQRPLLNIYGYTKADFSSETFTKHLNTKEGIDDLKLKGAKYLLVSKDVKKEDLLFFKTNENIKLFSNFDGYYLFTVL